MVGTRGRKGDASSSLPPRSPQARHTGTTRRTGASTVTSSSRRRTAAASGASVGSSRRTSSAASSVASSIASESEEELDPDDEEVDTDDDVIIPEVTSFQPPPQTIPVAKSSGSVSSTGSKQEKLDKLIEKQVLKDIEEEGGLHVFDSGKKQALSQLLDNPKRCRVYGERGDPLRAKISRRVRYLKGLKFQQYVIKLKQYKIEPAKLTKKQLDEIELSKAPKNIKAEAIKKEDLSDLEDNKTFPGPVDSSSVSRNFTSKPNLVVSRHSVKAEAAASSSASKVSHSSSRAVPAAAASSSATSNVQTSTMAEDFVNLWLDAAHPFDNPDGIMLSTFTGLEYAGSEYDGVTIMVQGDPRDVSADRFKLEVYDPPSRRDDQELAKPSRYFQLTMPLVPAGMWLDREELVGDGTAPKVVKNGLIVTMQSVKDLEEGQNTKEYVIGFKGGARMKLTDKPFIPADKPQDELTIKAFHPISFYETGHNDPEDKTPILNMGTYVCWRLIDLNSKRKMIDDEKGEPAGKSGVAAALAARKKAKKKMDDSSSPVKQEEEEDNVEDEDMEDLEEEMAGCQPGVTEEEEFDEYCMMFQEDQFMVIKPLLEAEVKRGGAPFQQLLIQICRYADSMWQDDPNQRDFATFVVDTVIHVNQEAERLELEHGMQKQGGKIRGTLLTQDEMEQQRKALFKPRPKRKKKKTRTNKKREDAQNKARNK